MNLVNLIENKFTEKKETPHFKAGDTITVYYKIKEGNKERTQFFKGDILQRRGSGTTETFTIRNMTFKNQFILASYPDSLF